MGITWDETFRFGGGATRVCVGGDILGEVGRVCRDVGAFGRALVVTDDNVAALYGEVVRDALCDAGVEATLEVVQAGDASKSLEQAGRLYDRLGAWRVARDDVVVGVGGGVVTDLAGFVGATWLRGVATVLCPTSLEADIDASIGGKTGVNHTSGKNLIGAFHQPQLVVMDTHCLRTLADRDVVAGMAESIKHALITGGDFLDWHEANAARVYARDEETLAVLIERNVRIKADVVLRDEREECGVRAFLNFGHTVGHAIEATSGYALRHGECVALGMVAACCLSELVGVLDGAVTERVVRILEAFGLPTRMTRDVDLPVLMERIGCDKKVAGGSVRFVLLRGIGEPVLQSGVSDVHVRAAIERVRPA